MNWNSLELAGNLTRDPQLKYLANQTPVVDFGLAVNRKWRDNAGQPREEVTFCDCSAFGKTAELINQHFRKGSPIFIAGRLKYDTWTDKATGQKRSKLSAFVERFQFVGPPPPRDAASNAGAATGRPAAAADAAELPADAFKEDDIPF